MILMLLALFAVADDGDVRLGFSAGFGRSDGRHQGSEERASPAWAADLGAGGFVHQGALWAGGEGSILIVKVPPGATFGLDITGQLGVAPWGEWGPHAAVATGVGTSLFQFFGHVGAVAGVGLGPVSVDGRVRWGGSIVSGQMTWRTLTLEVGLWLPAD